MVSERAARSSAVSGSRARASAALPVEYRPSDPASERSPEAAPGGTAASIASRSAADSSTVECAERLGRGAAGVRAPTSEKPKFLPPRVAARQEPRRLASCATIAPFSFLYSAAICTQKKGGGGAPQQPVEDCARGSRAPESAGQWSPEVGRPRRARTSAAATSELGPSSPREEGRRRRLYPFPCSSQVGQVSRPRSRASISEYYDLQVGDWVGRQPHDGRSPVAGPRRWPTWQHVARPDHLTDHRRPSASFGTCGV
jgi:hypothetical protein